MLRLLVACLLCSITALGQQPAAAKLSARVEFRCLWWSAEQKRNFNPNHPPPKTTEVVIDRWEYTDPVGVPHPDTITVHASIRNNDASKATGPVRMKAEIRWKTGPQLKPATAQWEPQAIFVASLDTAPIAPGEQVALQAPVAIQSKMNTLEKRDWWPHEMEVILTGTDLRTGRTLFREVRPFRIQPGD